MDVKGKLGEVADFLATVDDSNDPFDLIIARNEGDEDSPDYDFGCAKTVGTLPQQLGEFVEDKVDNKLGSLDGGTLEGTEYAASNIQSSNDYIQYVYPDEVPRFDDFKELLTTHEFPAREYITGGGAPPDFQVIMIRDGTDERVLAFQRVTRSYIHGRDGRIRFWSNDEHYRPVDQTILEIPNRIDALYYDDALLIFNQGNFERIFDYMAEFTAAAEETVGDIADSDVPIHTDDAFLDAVTSYPNASRLLYAVRERALWEHEDVDMSVFEFIIDEFDLKIAIEERDGEKGIVMDDKRLVWEVIHLYNDDHLNSPITEVGYQVGHKDARTE